ncbi:MAG: M28 family metallopeptidase [Promethearchaeota archaeon]
MSVNEENAYRITERLAFPRLVGSKGEKKAINIILEELQEARFKDIHREPFMTSFKLWRIGRIAFIPLGLLIILTSISYIIIPWLSLITSIITLLLLFKLLGITNAVEILLSKKEKYNHETENIYVELINGKPKCTITFLGHHDSKSQTMPIIVRYVVLIISAFGGLILLISFLILSVLKLIIPAFNFPIIDYSLLIISVACTLIAMTNFFNKTQNKSPGAKDNAASVGVIIELAQYFKNNPLKDTRLIFLLTGSEELNLGGAKSFILSHEHEFDRETSYFINLDTVGGNGAVKNLTAYGIPRKFLSKELETLFVEACKKFNISLKKLYLPTGAWADHAPFTQLGFKATTVGSEGGEREIHTVKDNLSLIDKKGLKNCLSLCVEVASAIQSKYS